MARSAWLAGGEGARVYRAKGFIQRVVDGLLRGDRPGRLLGAPCRIKLTKGHLDKSYAVSEITQVIGNLITRSGRFRSAVPGTCAACAKEEPALSQGTGSMSAPRLLDSAVSRVRAARAQAGHAGGERGNATQR